MKAYKTVAYNGEPYKVANYSLKLDRCQTMARNAYPRWTVTHPIAKFSY